MLFPFIYATVVFLLIVDIVPAIQLGDTLSHVTVGVLSAANSVFKLPGTYYMSRKFDSWKPQHDKNLRDELQKHIQYGEMIVLIYDIFVTNKNSVNVGKCYLGGKNNVNIVFQRLFPGFTIETLLKANPENLNRKVDEATFFGVCAFNSHTGELVVVYRGTVTTSEKVEDARSLGDLWLKTNEILGPDKNVNKWRRFRWAHFGAGRDAIVVHRGFKGVYTRAVQNIVRNNNLDSIQIRLRAVIDKLGSKIKKVTVTGHSLGAATAVICGLDISQYMESKGLLSTQPDDGKAKVEIISFACPKTANKNLGKEFRRLGVRHVHYLQRGDIVPSFMPGNYEHDDAQEMRRIVPAWEDGKRLVKKGFFDGFWWPFFAKVNSLALWHNMEYMLYNMALIADLPPRDVAYLNKGGDYVEDHHQAPKNWFNPVQRVFVRNGDKKLVEEVIVDRKVEVAKAFAEMYASYYGK
mmetsp:Transcript_20210/g.28985  ORF Transcript_20210/g.28985 Transcript_20210/m.28985 type:complete len:464 (-) Transcript_20210:146-1537(-)